MITTINNINNNINNNNYYSNALDSNLSTIAPAVKNSTLPNPIIRLTGHSAEVFNVTFSPSGKFLASASMDRQILLWNVGENNDNWGTLKGHTNAVLDLKWSISENYLFSASADKQVCQWDVETNTRIRRFKGHKSTVAQVQVCTETLIFSGSDDRSVLVWDTRTKRSVDRIQCSVPVCALAVAQGTGDIAYVGSVDRHITAYDPKSSKKPIYTLTGHADTVTGLGLDTDGFQLLSVSLNGEANVWDVKPFSIVPNRLIKSLPGLVACPSTVNMQIGWSKSKQLCASGSLGDSTVVIWDVFSGMIKYKLPGHRGGVPCVHFHPNQPIIASGGVDGVVYVGEIES